MIVNDSDKWVIPDGSQWRNICEWLTVICCDSYFKTIWSLNWIWESVKKLRKASSVNFNRISEGRNIITFNELLSLHLSNLHYSLLNQWAFSIVWKYLIDYSPKRGRTLESCEYIFAGWCGLHKGKLSWPPLTLDDLSWPLQATIDHQLRPTNSVNELNHEETVKVQERIGRKNRLRSCRSISESDLSNQSYSCRRKC